MLNTHCLWGTGFYSWIKIAFFNDVVGKIGFQEHAHKQVKMVSHTAKSQYLSKIQFVFVLDKADQKAVFNLTKRESVKRCA